MRAIIVDPTDPQHFRISESEAPNPTPQQTVISVHHASINHGDRVRSRIEKAGTVLGMDAAGIVVQAGAGGPAVGARVACFGLSSWAELVAVDVDRVAAVPDSVDLVDATALATSGVTALRALRAAGSVLGRVVLISGASGAVGRAAIQLAALSGAHVVAVVSSDARAEGLAALGAHEIVVGAEGIARSGYPLDVVIDNVGGTYLVAAFQRLAPGGHLISIGCASSEASSFPPYSTFAFGAARTIVDASGIMFAVPNVGKDLEVLLGNVRAKRLSAEVGWRGSWEKAAEGLSFRGKAVLDLR